MRNCKGRNAGTNRPNHLVSAWASERGLTRAQVSTDEKSNEITAIPELLKLLDLKGAVITIDAMGTQTKIAQQIDESNGDFILALKKNHSNFHEAVIDFVDEHVNSDFREVKHVQLVEESPKSKHGRLESRTYVQFEVPEGFESSEKWSGLKSFGLVVYRWTEDGVEKSEIRYYLSSLELDIDVFSRCIRSHWGIETTCHWSLDVTYREDALAAELQRPEPGQSTVGNWPTRKAASLGGKGGSLPEVEPERRTGLECRSTIWQADESGNCLPDWNDKSSEKVSRTGP